DGPSPTYYRRSGHLTQPHARIGIGLEMRGARAGGDSATALSIDLLYGLAQHLGPDTHAGIWIEAGYSYAGFGDHLAVLGAGPAMIGLEPKVEALGGFSFAIVPHALLGRIDGETGYGVRTSVVACFSRFGIEVAHQVLFVGPERWQELHIMF